MTDEIKLRYNDTVTIGAWDILSAIRITDNLRNALHLACSHFFPHAQEIWIEHVGTVASEDHYKRNPNSKHSGIPPTPPPQKHPPAAIDIRSVTVLTGAGITSTIDFTHNLDNRRILAAWWEENITNGNAYHENDAGRNHIHLEVAE